MADILTGEIAKITLKLLLTHSDYSQAEPYRGYFKEDETSRFVAFDNSTGDCWVEDFDTEIECKEYLN